MVLLEGVTLVCGMSIIISPGIDFIVCLFGVSGVIFVCEVSIIIS